MAVVSAYKWVIVVIYINYKFVAIFPQLKTVKFDYLIRVHKLEHVSYVALVWSYESEILVLSTVYYKIAWS